MDRNKEISYNNFLSYRPGLDELTEHVDVGTKWYLLGTLLHLDDRRLDGINQLQGQDDTDKTLKMFQHWLTTTPTASRRQVLEALRKRVISQHTVADQYEAHLKELHELTYKPPSVEAVSIIQRHIHSLNEGLVSPVQVSQLLYSKGCISEATLDEMERIDQSRSLDGKKTTLLTAIQETVSSDYRKLKDITIVLSDVEETRDIANGIMTEYEKIHQEDVSVVQPKEVVGGSKGCACDILRNNYSALSQSITEPVRVARWLHEEVISDEVLSCVMSTRGSLTDCRAVLLKAVRDAVHSNYKHLELFVTVLRKFSETSHIGDAIFEEYNKCCPDDKNSSEEIGCCFKLTADAKGQASLGHKILIPRHMSPQFTLIRTKFGAMFYEIRSLITGKDLNPDKVKKLICDCFADLKPKLECKKALEDILDVVKEKCSLIDVYCLEVLLTTFKITEGQTFLDSYNKTVKEFCQSMPARLCVDQILQVVRTPTRLASETVVFVLDWNPDEATLEDIKNLLSKSLDTNFIIEKIGTGRSVVVTCYCPAEYIGPLITTVLEKIEILQKRGLKEFIVGNCTVWDCTANELMSKELMKKGDENEDKELMSLKQPLTEKDKQLQQQQLMLNSSSSEFNGDAAEDLKQQLQMQYKINKMKNLEIENLKATFKRKSDVIAEQPVECQVDWRNTEVQLVAPSKQQCLEVLTKLGKEYHHIYLRESSSDIAQVLIPPLLEKDHFIALYVSSTSLTQDFLLTFSHQMSGNNTLQTLSLTNNCINDEGVSTLMQSLKYNKKLLYLSLEFNHGITSACVPSLADFIRANCTLSVLYLSCTNIDANGVQKLAESLKTNKTLNKLVIDQKHKAVCSSDEFLVKSRRLEFSYKYADT